AMVTREPDADAARDLFTELEFTTLAKDFAPTVSLGETEYREAKSAADVQRVLRAVSAQAPLAFVLEAAAETSASEEEPEPPEQEETGMLALTAAAETTPPSAEAEGWGTRGGTRGGTGGERMAIAVRAGEALMLALDEGEAAAALRVALGDAALPK